MTQLRRPCPDQTLCAAGDGCAGRCGHEVIPPGRLVNGQWQGVPISRFAQLQEEVRRGLADGTLSVQ